MSGPGGRGPGGPGMGPKGFAKPKNMGKVIKRLLHYMAGKNGAVYLGLVLLFIAVSAACNVAGTYFANVVIIENLMAGEYATMSKFIGALTVLIGIYGVGVIATYMQSFIMVRLAMRGVNRLRKDLFEKMQDLPLAYFDRHPHGELMSRFTNDADQVQTALEQSMVSLFSSGILFVFLVLVMLFLSPILFVITALTLFTSLMAFRFFGGRSRISFKKQQSSLGDMNGNIQEMIEGLKVVKAFTHEEVAKETFGGLNTTYRDAATDANYNASVIMPMSNNIVNIGYALTAGVGAVLTVFTPFGVGALIGYLQYSRQTVQPMNQVAQQMNAVLSALAGAERIFEAMDEMPELDEGNVTLVRANRSATGELTLAKESETSQIWAWHVPTENGADLVELKGEVRFHDVEFSYVPEKKILKGISVHAKPGQKIAFVGSTGAGKTTITNLINRFYEIQKGTITYDGIDVTQIKKDDLRHSLGAVLQDTHLFTGSVMDNIRYGRLDATDEECIQAAKTAGAHSFVRRLPEGYQTPVVDDGGNLSQGQRQLLAIARAAVANPPVMILDEATSSIDTRTEVLIQKGMDALMEGRTVFVIAHRLSTVRNSNAIMVIEAGEIIERGSHDELLEQNGRYSRLYNGQFSEN